jgi:hypothetical protein
MEFYLAIINSENQIREEYEKKRKAKKRVKKLDGTAL